MTLARVTATPPSISQDNGGEKQTDDAFQALFARHSEALTGYCRSLVGNEHDAGDVMQNVALRALLALRRGVVPTQERAWLFRIVHNEAISLFRARRSLITLDEELPATADDPERAALSKEQVAETLNDLGALGRGVRHIVLLGTVRGLSRDEIADQLGLTPSAVSHTLSQARARLKADRTARELACEVVRSVMSNRDGRRRRTAAVRAHLRGCQSCRTWLRQERRGRIVGFIPIPVPISLLLRGLQSGEGLSTGSACLAIQAPNLGVPRAVAVMASVVACAGATAAQPRPEQHRASSARIAQTASKPTIATSSPVGAARTTTPIGVRRMTSPVSGAVTTARPTFVIQGGGSPRSAGAPRTPASSSSKRARPDGRSLSATVRERTGFITSTGSGTQSYNRMQPTQADTSSQPAAAGSGSSGQAPSGSADGTAPTASTHSPSAGSSPSASGQPQSARPPGFA
jgi:RNA polymerase sigma factor (sigma-70 family)